MFNTKLKIGLYGPAGAGKLDSDLLNDLKNIISSISVLVILLDLNSRIRLKLDLKVQAIVESYSSFSDDLVNEMVKNKRQDSESFILDGYPRMRLEKILP